MKLSQLADVIQYPAPDQDCMLNHFCIDSREVKPGDVFIAIKGEYQDGKTFISQAIEQGARAIIVESEYHEPCQVPLFKVDSAQNTLANCARFWREQHDIKIAAITGSSGKTTVKGLLTSICEQHAQTLSTKGNYNNELGLPLTLLNLSSEHKLAVLEMGAAKIGDINYLCHIAKPNVVLVNNVFPAHVETFGSLQNIATAKSEIYSSLPEDGIAVLNRDSQYSEYFLNRIAGRRTISYSLRDIRANVYANNIRFMNNAMQFELVLFKKQVWINLPLLGEHNVANALAAAAMAHAMGLSVEEIQQGLESYQGTDARLMSMPGLNQASIIDDTYNANPGSVAAAIKVLSAFDGDKILVMGDMAELGKNAKDYHYDIGKQAKELGIDKLYCVGKFARSIQDGFGYNAFMFEQKWQLADALLPYLNQKTTVLVKGSRSSKMEDILHKIKRSD